MAGAGGTRLRVMVDEDPPFVVKDGERWSGWAIDLWTEIAREAGLDWDVVGDGEPADIANDLAAGRVDIGLGAIRVTKENAARIDFSHPFSQVSARILVLKAQGGEVAAALRSVATPAHARVLLAVLGLVAGMSGLIYVLARRHDAANFPATRSEGIAEAVYVAVSALLQGKLERKLLPGWSGRVLSTVWLVFGTAVVAYVTDAIAAALAVQHLSSRLQDVADLVGKPVAAVKGHQTVPWLARRGINALRRTISQSTACSRGGSMRSSMTSPCSRGGLSTTRPPPCSSSVSRLTQRTTPSPSGMTARSASASTWRFYRCKRRGCSANSTSVGSVPLADERARRAIPSGVPRGRRTSRSSGTRAMAFVCCASEHEVIS
jgi:ABC-type amino acid transport substrate-binding protein